MNRTSAYTLAIIACVGAAGSVSAADDSAGKPRRINDIVSVVDAPAAAATLPAVQQMTLGTAGAPIRVAPDGSVSMDLSERLPLGMGGYIDEHGELHSECSDRPVDLRLRHPLARANRGKTR